MDIEQLKKMSINLADCSFRWLFEDDQGNLPIEEWQDQIFVLSYDGKDVLKKYSRPQSKLFELESYEEVSEYCYSEDSEKEVKKYLYNLGIPFSQCVVVNSDRFDKMVMTWKMVIKFSEGLFLGVTRRYGTCPIHGCCIISIMMYFTLQIT